MKLVVGLGNPGREYERTRHNLGFDVLEELARRFFAPAAKLKHDASLTEVQIGREKVLLAAPQTFMNLSGRSVRQIVDFYKIPLSDILLICDDLALPTAKLRLRGSGTAGGQKGLQNTIDQLGSNQFARLRIGIDRPRPGFDTSDYVLGRFNKPDREKIETAIQLAADAVEQWTVEGLDAAMNRVNSAP
ncbi:MAG: aminoacyl-tRNA hydrolase [Planctomycetaceae bacterium]